MKNKLNQFLNEDCLSIESNRGNFQLHISSKFMIALAIPPAIVLLAYVF